MSRREWHFAFLYCDAKLSFTSFWCKCFNQQCLIFPNQIITLVSLLIATGTKSWALLQSLHKITNSSMPLMQSSQKFVQKDESLMVQWWCTKKTKELKSCVCAMVVAAAVSIIADCVSGQWHSTVTLRAKEKKKEKRRKKRKKKKENLQHFKAVRSFFFQSREP